MAWIRACGGSSGLNGNVEFTFRRDPNMLCILDVNITINGANIYSETINASTYPQTLTRTFVNSGYTYTVIFNTVAGNNCKAKITISDGNVTPLDVETPVIAEVNPYVVTYSYLI